MTRRYPPTIPKPLPSEQDPALRRSDTPLTHALLESLRSQPRLKDIWTNTDVEEFMRLARRLERDRAVLLNSMKRAVEQFRNLAWMGNGVVNAEQLQTIRAYATDAEGAARSAIKQCEEEDSDG